MSVDGDVGIGVKNEDAWLVKDSEGDGGSSEKRCGRNVNFTCRRIWEDANTQRVLHVLIRYSIAIASHLFVQTLLSP